MPLTDTAIRSAKPRQKPYKLSDGDGLVLLVQPNGARWWRQRYHYDGREKMLSVGVYPDVSLKQAREKSEEVRRLVVSGIDPSSKRQAEKVARADTFRAVGEEWLTLLAKPPAKSKTAPLAPDTVDAIRSRLETYLYPKLGNRPISKIKAMELLAEIKKPEGEGLHDTAHRLRSAASRIFRYAIVTNRAEHDIAADLRGALAANVITHHAAIKDPERLRELLIAIDGYRGQPLTRIALQLSPLVFTRPSELRLAKWTEFKIDWDAGKVTKPEWRIPHRRMKMKEDHIVPLATQAIVLLERLIAITGPITGPDGYLFPSIKDANRPMSNNTVNSALRAMDFAGDEMTGHGFRTTASTLLNEQEYNSDHIEMQLSHDERNKSRASYNAAKWLTQRRKMLQEWADYLENLRAS